MIHLGDKGDTGDPGDRGPRGLIGLCYVHTLVAAFYACDHELCS